MLVAITMNIMGRRRKRSDKNFDIGEANDGIHELLNNGYTMTEHTDFISPLVMRFENVILQGESLYINV